MQIRGTLFSKAMTVAFGREPHYGLRERLDDLRNPDDIRLGPLALTISIAVALASAACACCLAYEGFAHPDVVSIGEYGQPRLSTSLFSTIGYLLWALAAVCAALWVNIVISFWGASAILSRTPAVAVTLRARFGTRVALAVAVVALAAIAGYLSLQLPAVVEVLGPNMRPDIETFTNGLQSLLSGAISVLTGLVTWGVLTCLWFAGARLLTPIRPLLSTIGVDASKTVLQLGSVAHRPLWTDWWPNPTSTGSDWLPHYADLARRRAADVGSSGELLIIVSAVWMAAVGTSPFSGWWLAALAAGVGGVLLKVYLQPRLQDRGRAYAAAAAVSVEVEFGSFGPEGTSRSPLDQGGCTALQTGASTKRQRALRRWILGGLLAATGGVIGAALRGKTLDR